MVCKTPISSGRLLILKRSRSIWSASPWKRRNTQSYPFVTVPKTVLMGLPVCWLNSQAAYISAPHWPKPSSMLRFLASTTQKMGASTVRLAGWSCAIHTKLGQSKIRTSLFRSTEAMFLNCCQSFEPIAGMVQPDERVLWKNLPVYTQPGNRVGGFLR